MTPGSRSPGKCGLAGHQIEVFGMRLRLDHPGARRAPDAVQQRQRNPDADALLDRQHDDRGRGRHDQEELAERLPGNRDDLADADDPQGYENQVPSDASTRETCWKIPEDQIHQPGQN